MSGESTMTEFEAFKACIQSRLASPPAQIVKSSYASMRPVPNASTANKSAGDPYNIIAHIEPGEVEHDCYTIDRLIGVCELTHKSITLAMKNWLVRKLHQHGTPRVSCESALTPFGENQLWLTPVKIADIVVKNDNIVIMQFEVESSHDRAATVRKLSYGLVDQLRFLKNRCVDTNSVVGFFVPVQEGYVEKVQCEWSDKDLEYTIATIQLSREQVEVEVCTTYETQSTWCQQLSLEHDSFIVPLTPSYIKRTWNEHAYQLKSGASIVILSPDENSVFKKPLGSCEFQRLLLLRESNLQLQHCVLPTHLVLKGSAFFFTFRQCLPPSSRSEAKAHVVAFVSQVVNALQELHDSGCAHQDVRLENICYCPTTFEVVLIDMDRSCTADKPASLQSRYGKSTMYSLPASSPWKAWNIDWRQLGILITFILSEPVITNYHKILVARDGSFVSTLFNEG